MQNSSNLAESHPVAYPSQDDEAELFRVKNMASTQGLGEEVYLDDAFGESAFAEVFDFGGKPE